MLLMVAGSVAAVSAATLPSGFSETLVVNGLSNPTAMAFAPDGRLFICLQGGQLRIVKNGSLLAAPFLTVTVNSSGERGLLGVAFDPNFAANQYVYVYYTATTPTIHNRVSRFTASGDIGSGETIILELDNLSTATNHNGGAIHFGDDGKLYIAVGENATPSNAQTLANLHGKMLRINADGSIPTDNPFYLEASGKNRAIWALGLRNPFTFAFQPQQTQTRMFINDVGQNAYEEINDGIAGSNYGWPNSEGATSNPAHRGPIYYYHHSMGDVTGCAITGGAFYNPVVEQFPAGYVGDYFFADYCGGWIKRRDTATGSIIDFATGISAPVDLQLNPDGSLYYLARGAGAVYRVEYTANQAPVISQQPADLSVPAGQPATFSVSASANPSPTYRWQRNRIDIPGATSTSYTIASVSSADNGALFRCIVSNSLGSATSREALLTVTGGGNSPPVATITQPASGTHYAGGATIAYAGTGTDPQEGNLPASAFTWWVDFYHDDSGEHFHPFVPNTSGATFGNFTVPRTGETSANVWYRIYLTVRDSGGLTATTFRDVRPQTVSITVQSQTSGLTLTLDGQPFASAITLTAVVGMTRSIGALSPQTMGGWTYTFKSWSDGGAATHAITVPAVSTTYTARFQRSKR